MRGGEASASWEAMPWLPSTSTLALLWPRIIPRLFTVPRRLSRPPAVLSPSQLWRMFAMQFVGTMPAMIEIAGILSAVLGSWVDFWIIFALLMTNATLGFIEEMNAQASISALKDGTRAHPPLHPPSQAATQRSGGRAPRGVAGAPSSSCASTPPLAALPGGARTLGDDARPPVKSCSRVLSAGLAFAPLRPPVARLRPRCPLAPAAFARARARSLPLSSLTASRTPSRTSSQA